MIQIDITPVAKPRMTRRDNRPPVRKPVAKYRAFADLLRIALRTPNGPFVLSDRFVIVFYLPMPKSWSEKKKTAHAGMPHQQTPDIDNLVKAVMDALSKSDAHVWNVWARKIWAYEGQIELTNL